VQDRQDVVWIDHVLCHQPKSFDWRLRKARAHPLGALSNALFLQVCERLSQIIQVGRSV
jgi:mRNA interferase MazF